MDARRRPSRSPRSPRRMGSSSSSSSIGYLPPSIDRRIIRSRSRSASVALLKHLSPARSPSPITGDQRRRREKSQTSRGSSRATLEMGDEPNGMLLRRGSTSSRKLSPQRGTPASDDKPSELVTLNISGLRFQTYERTLQRYPNTLLGSKSRRQRYWCPDTKEYFFDRHRSSFESILYIYQSGGRVRRPDIVPQEVYVKELRFFQMGDDFIHEFWVTEGHKGDPEVLMPTNPLQKRIWELMEYPDSSLSARIIAFISVAVIIISIVSFCWETVPSYEITSNSTDNSTAPESNNHDEKPVSPFFVVECICIVWFSIELFLRFISCPSKRAFCSFLNIIDFIAIAPFFVNLFMNIGEKTSKEASAQSTQSMSFAVLRVLRLVRVFRIFKLSRHSAGLQILGKTFQASLQELGLLVFFMLIALILFSSGIYFAEQGETNTKFLSIPHSFWFVIATMTTVGYGDLVPAGVWGKVVGSCCAMIGVLTLALPVPIIVANFKHFYREERMAVSMKLLVKDTEDPENEEYGEA